MGKAEIKFNDTKKALALAGAFLMNDAFIIAESGEEALNFFKNIL